MEANHRDAGETSGASGESGRLPIRMLRSCWRRLIRLREHASLQVLTREPRRDGTGSPHTRHGGRVSALCARSVLLHSALHVTQLLRR